MWAATRATDVSEVNGLAVERLAREVQTWSWGWGDHLLELAEVGCGFGV